MDRSGTALIFMLAILLTINGALFSYLQIATGYNAPTTVYAKLIDSQSRLMSVPYNPTPSLWSWRSTLFWEQSYPLPAIIEVMLSSVLGTDLTYGFLMPVLASNMIFPFVWARSLGWKNKYALAYSITLISYLASITTISRHTFGEYLLYASFVPLFMLVGGKIRRSRELLVLILLFLLPLAFSHQGFLGFATAGLVALSFASWGTRDSRGKVFSVAGLFSVFLFLFVNPFILYAKEWGYVPTSLGDLFLRFETLLTAIWLHNVLQVPYTGGALLINPPRPEAYNWVSHVFVGTKVIFGLSAVVIVCICLARILTRRQSRRPLGKREIVAFLIVGSMMFDALSYSLIFLSIPVGLAAGLGPLLLPTTVGRLEHKPLALRRRVISKATRFLTPVFLCIITISSCFMLTGIPIFGSGASYPFEAYSTAPMSHFLAAHSDRLVIMGTPDSTSKVFAYLPVTKITEVDTVRYGTEVYLLSEAMQGSQSELNQVFVRTGANAWVLTRSEFEHVVWGEVAGYSVPPFSSYATAETDARLNMVYSSSNAMLLVVSQ